MILRQALPGAQEVGIPVDKFFELRPPFSIVDTEDKQNLHEADNVASLSQGPLHNLEVLPLRRTDLHEGLEIIVKVIRGCSRGLEEDVTVSLQLEIDLPMGHQTLLRPELELQRFLFVVLLRRLIL